MTHRDVVPMRLRREGFRPARDIVIALTADEETTGNRIRWLLANDPDVKRAAVALNTDAGDGMLQGDRRLVLGVQASEKVYVSYQLEVRNPGGHSSVRRSDNAIYQLAHALSRLSTHQCPVKLNEVTRTYLARTGELGGPDAADMRRAGETPADPAAIERLARNPSYGSAMRTTCVATMLEGGHAENALPQTARAVVNCRVLPGESLEEVERALAQVIADKRCDEHPGTPGGATFSWRGGDSRDVGRRHRWPFRAECRHSGLWRVGDIL